MHAIHRGLAALNIEGTPTVVEKAIAKTSLVTGVGHLVFGVLFAYVADLLLPATLKHYSYILAQVR